jgi:hypothetical protein
VRVEDEALTAYRPAGNGEEGRAGQAVEEAADQHRGSVLCDGAGDQPDEEEGKGRHVDGAAAVEL